MSDATTDPTNAAGATVAPSVTYGRRTARGVLWSALAVLITKASSFVSQLALGWLLSKDDFGIYAIAVSAGSLASVFKDGGTRKILIHQGDQFERLATPVFQLSLAFNCATAGVLALAAPWIGQAYRATELPPLLWIVAASIVLSTFGTVQRTKLTVDLRFRANSAISAASAVLRHAATVLFALLGFGPQSFVLPLILVALFEAAAGYVLVGSARRGPSLDWATAKLLMGQSQWLILSTLLMVLSLQGDYLVAGAIQTKEVLGVYFFAFQLTVALSAPFSSSVNAVLTPSLARLKDDVPRQGKALLKSLRVLAMIAAPACTALVVIAAPAVAILWRGKWDAAVGAVQVLALSLPLRLLTPISMSLIDSRGQWRRGALLMALDAAGTLGAAALGAALGDAVVLAACVSAERAVVSVVQCVAAARLVHVPLGELAGAVFVPFVASLACAAAAVALALELPQGNCLQLAARLALVMLLFSITARLVLRSRLSEVIAFFRGGMAST